MVYNSNVVVYNVYGLERLKEWLINIIILPPVLFEKWGI